MKIAVFSYGLPSVGRQRGGIERVAHELANGLARRGHAVTVWSADLPPSKAAYTTRQLPGSSLVNNWLGRRLTMGYLGNILAILPRYYDDEVIIAHGDSLLLPLLRKPVIRVMHGSALGEAISARTPWRFIFQFGVYLQELLTALTQPGCTAVSWNSIRYNPFISRVIRNGVDTSIFYPDLNGKTRQPSLLFVGDLMGRKRGNLLLTWFRDYVLPAYPQATLDMVSSQGAQISGVRYHTAISSDDLALLYRRSWIYASPSVYEGFGLPYLEAMASGTAVIATPNPGSREILDNGRCGWLTNDSEFGPLIVRLIQNTEERNLLIKLGLQRTHHYSIEHMITEYESLAFQLCSSGKARPTF